MSVCACLHCHIVVIITALIVVDYLIGIDFIMRTFRFRSPRGWCVVLLLRDE